MIRRIWHGWTKPENADKYEQLLKDKIFPGIAAKGVQGYNGIELLWRSHQKEVEFITIMKFDNWEAVKAFGGEDYLTAYVPKEAQKVLAHYDDQSQHYEVKMELEY